MLRYASEFPERVGRYLRRRLAGDPTGHTATAFAQDNAAGQQCFLAVIVLALLVVCIPSPVAAAILFNGSFEETPCEYYQGRALQRNDMEGWFIPVSSDPDYVPYPQCMQNGFVNGPTPYGAQWLVLGSTAHGVPFSIEQATAVTAGTHTLSFAIASESGSPSAVGVTVLTGGLGPQEVIFQAEPAAVKSWDVWTTKTVNFTVLTPRSVTVVFRDANSPNIPGGGSGRVGLDNVTIDADCVEQPPFAGDYPGPGKKPLEVKGAGWKMTAEVSANDGLVLRDVMLSLEPGPDAEAQNGQGYRYMATMMSLPYFEVKLKERPSSEPHQLTSARLVDFRATEPLVPLTIEAVYRIEGAAYGVDKSCITVTQRYEFHPANPTDHCEISGGVPCARYTPLVRYLIEGDPLHQIDWIKFPQRFHFEPDALADNSSKYVVAITRDVDNPTPYRSTDELWDLIKNQLDYVLTEQQLRGYVIDEAMDGNPMEKENTRRPVVIDSPKEFFYDNYHQTWNTWVEEPHGEIRIGPDVLVAGCPECIHMHWRWIDVKPLIKDPKTAPEVRAVLERFRDSNDGLPQMEAHQDLMVGVTKYDLTEVDPYPTPYWEKGKPGESLKPGRLVFWYEGKSHALSGAFLTHGAFFSPRIGSYVRNKPEKSQPALASSAPWIPHLAGLDYAFIGDVTPLVDVVYKLHFDAQRKPDYYEVEITNKSKSDLPLPLFVFLDNSGNGVYSYRRQIPQQTTENILRTGSKTIVQLYFDFTSQLAPSKNLNKEIEDKRPRILTNVPREVIDTTWGP